MRATRTSRFRSRGMRQLRSNWPTSSAVCPARWWHRRARGGLLVGLWGGFRALASGRAREPGPRLVGVQAARCATLARAAGVAVPEDGGGPTCAEGIRVDRPVRGAELVDLVHHGNLEFAIATEREIREGREELARRGFGVELSSAVIWAAVGRGLVSGQWRPPVVGVLTAHALKTPIA